MATVPRIPQEMLEGYFIQMERSEDNDNPVAAISIPIELSRLAGIPVRTKKSFQLDPVLHELIRLYNAKVQDCQYCQNARQAVAVQAGLDEDMVSALSHFETSALPENIKAALRITSVVSTNPGLLTDEIWAKAAEFFTEDELVDIVLLSMHTTASKVTITLGLDPGKEASSRLFFPTEDVYGESPELAEAIADLRSSGVVVDGPQDAPLPVGYDRRVGREELSVTAMAVADSSFDQEVLDSPTPVLVDFWAQWCGPCRMMAPMVDEIATTHAETLRVVKVDIDEAAEVTERYDIASVPTFAVFVGGELVKRMSGAKAKSALLRDLADYL